MQGRKKKGKSGLFLHLQKRESSQVTGGAKRKVYKVGNIRVQGYLRGPRKPAWE